MAKCWSALVHQGARGMRNASGERRWYKLLEQLNLSILSTVSHSLPLSLSHKSNSSQHALAQSTITILAQLVHWLQREIAPHGCLHWLLPQWRLHRAFIAPLGVPFWLEASVGSCLVGRLEQGGALGQLDGEQGGEANLWGQTGGGEKGSANAGNEHTRRRAGGEACLQARAAWRTSIMVTLSSKPGQPLTMAARPLSISAAGVKGPKASALAPRVRGTREAAMKMMKARAMPVGSDVHCLSTLSPELNSAPTAATKPSMARRPLVVSGAAPLKAIRAAWVEKGGGRGAW